MPDIQVSRNTTSTTYGILKHISTDGESLNIDGRAYSVQVIDGKVRVERKDISTSLVDRFLSAVKDFFDRKLSFQTRAREYSEVMNLLDGYKIGTLAFASHDGNKCPIEGLHFNILKKFNVDFRDVTYSDLKDWGINISDVSEEELVSAGITNIPAPVKKPDPLKKPDPVKNPDETFRYGQQEEWNAKFANSKNPPSTDELLAEIEKLNTLEDDMAAQFKRRFHDPVPGVAAR